MDASKSMRLVTAEHANSYIFSHSDANGFPRLLPPARKIGLGRRALAGMMPTEKGASAMPARFESSLERDFFVLLEFNVDVVRWDPQPIRLDLGPGCGTYVPDVLATFSAGQEMGAISAQHVLYEVKYRDELRRSWASLRPRYQMAHRFARAHGWRFKLVTEREIRTELLWNAKFLLPYRHDQASEADCQRLLEALSASCETTPGDLLATCSPDRMVQARLLTSLWHLVASRVVGTDLRRRLTMRSRIWSDA